MPMDRSLYPPDWEQIALEVKESANWQCQQCGKHCRRKGESPFDFMDRIQTGRLSECPMIRKFLEHPRSFTLTVAHLNHQPSDCRPENLKAMCAPCHCRYDLAQMPLKKTLKLERAGQLSLGVNL